jgi:hypothetical protein
VAGAPTLTESPEDSPPARSDGPRFRRPRGYRHGRRTAASALFLVALVLAGVAIGTAWWTETATYGDTTQSFSFYPGAQVTLTQSCDGPQPSHSCSQALSTSYDALKLTNTGALYATVEVLVLGALGATLLATFLGFLGAFGLNFGRTQLSLTLLLALLAFALLLAAPVWAAAGQPAALQSDTTALGSTGVGGPGDSSFWGTNSSGVTTFTWGAAAGWYSAVAAAGLLLLGSILLVSSRRDAYTSDEIGLGFVPSEPIEAVAPEGPVEYDAAGTPWMQTPPSVGTCPACGSNNRADAWVCWKCQRPLR